MKTVDLCWFGEVHPLHWNSGQLKIFQPNCPNTLLQLQEWILSSDADYILFWSAEFPLVSEDTLQVLLREEVDLVHVGLRLGAGEFWPELNLVIQDWSMINLSPDVSGSSWRANWRMMLVRRDLWLKIGGLDRAFISLDAAVLAFGYRCLQQGALLEYRAELLEAYPYALPEPSRVDLYIFLLRTYGRLWARYVMARQLVSSWHWFSELEAWKTASQRVAIIPEPSYSVVWYESETPDLDQLCDVPVSVIIPTLGRYPYLLNALHSLRNQTVPPREVIVIDQNPLEHRQPQLYEEFEDLNLQVIWQDEKGQSLARNSGIAAAACPFVFLFDDDSVASKDLIECHLRFVFGWRFQVSTGVSYPPPPAVYELPPTFRHPRVSQTLDTGNSLMPRELLKQSGGLDRNYDFGPGTDMDLGTRLYLAGFRIAHNPTASRIHFKAPLGGLRVHGSHKYNTDMGWLTAFPPITQTYYGLRYLTQSQRRERAWLQFVTSKFPKEVRKRKIPRWKILVLWIIFTLNLFFFPIKFFRSTRMARQLLKHSPRLMDKSVVNGP